MLRIQGFPDSYRIVTPYSKVKHQCGNSVAVPVIQAVARQMLDALKQQEVQKEENHAHANADKSRSPEEP